MSGGHRVALVASPSTRRDETVAALDEADRLRVESFVPKEASAESLSDADAVVVLDREELPICQVEGCPPIVLYSDDPIAETGTIGGIAGFARVGDVSALVDQIRWVSHERRNTRSRLGRLHDGTATLVGTRFREGLYQQVVDIAERILSFDNCDLMIAEDGRFVSKAARGRFSGTNTMPLDHGLLGETYQRGESFLVNDIQRHDLTAPDSDDFRAGISVPFGDVGVLQIVSTRPNVFDRTDVQLVEILVSYAVQTLSRIETEEALRTEHRHLRALFENVPDPAVEYQFVDGKPIVRAVNDAFVDVFGYERTEILGRDIDEYIVPTDPDDGSDLASEAAAFNQKLLSGERVRHECQRQTVDGLREFLLKIVPLKRDRRNVAGYAIYTDITEQKRRERTLARENERLEEFASVVSHDLRNPLGIARGHLELARETGREASFEMADAALERMDGLIEDVLTLARQGQVVGDAEEVDAVAVARTAWNTVDTPEARLRTEGPITVVADTSRLRELFENLFRNAVEHGRPDRSCADGVVTEGGSSEDGESRALTVSVEPTPNGFAVVDDGRGVPESDREALFEPGHSGSESGTGFGLAIVRRIAESHGWSISLAESEPGEGARFEIRTE
jgi:PAS domain S-box-containing protein